MATDHQQLERQLRDIISQADRLKHSSNFVVDIEDSDTLYRVIEANSDNFLTLDQVKSEKDERAYFDSFRKKAG